MTKATRITDWEDQRDLREALIEWIADIRMAGGVSDHGEDTYKAISAVTNLCWAVHCENGYSHNDMTQLGIKWVSAFVVSCAKHGTGNLHAVFDVNDKRQAVFGAEAAKNIGVVANLLDEAATTHEMLFASAMAGVTVNQRITPPNDRVDL